MLVQITLTNGDVKTIPLTSTSSVTVSTTNPDGSVRVASYGEVASVETVPDPVDEPEPEVVVEPAPAVEEPVAEPEPETVAVDEPAPVKRARSPKKPADA